MFASAWWYYQRCVLANRAKAMLKRLRQPKYVIGLALTVTYLGWIFFFNPALSGDGTRSADEVRGNTAVVAAAFYLLQIVITWFALSSGRGVAFREAEVQLLFPRPFTRWQILRFKWLSGQPGALIGSLIIGLMFHRFSDVDYGLVVAGFWINQSVLYAHATLVGLWLAHLKAKGGRAARCTSLPAWTMLTALLVCAASGWAAVGDATGWAAARAVAQTPWLAALSWPFTKLADLMLAPDLAGFAAAAVVPLLLLVVHGFVIWWADFRFEDQAVEIAAKIQNIKSEGIGALASKKDLVVGKPRQPWQLAPTGPAWHALVWKNVISLGRLPKRLAIRLGFVILILVAIFSSMLVGQGDAPHVPTRIGFLLLGLLGYVSLLAPSMVRVDLRIDIPHFDVLKAMPLRGRSLIFGEVMGTVLVLWVVQAIGCLTAAILIVREGQHVFVWLDKAPALVGVLSVFFAVDFALVTSENLMALWLPGFVRLGRGVRTGFDNIGQNLMGALIRMFALMVLVVGPVFAGIALGALVHGLGLPAVPSVVTGGVVFAALLCGESWLLMCLSEGRYQRFDITSENVTGDAD
ncbi:MAG TPA: putative ABC exporter domain-containing protein [Planctomycetota bacterium]|nr:putative ABC exporter domain-containing protein [Planctomycetota bacterium]